MNTDTLKQYASIKNEIQLLEEKIMDGGTCVSDVIKCSDTKFPYTKRSIRITGISKHSDHLRIRLRERERKLKVLNQEIEDFIDTINDSKVRQLIEYKYLRGLSWLVASRKVFEYPCEDRARKRVKRYLERL